MKVYVDLLFILNVWIDFLLLLTVSYVLKKFTSIRRILCASFVGGISTIFLFLNVSSTILALLKVLICSLMLLISFSFNSLKSFIENIIYFYLVSIILAGVIYLVRNNYNINNFFNNFLLLIVTTPIILYVYYRKTKKLNNHYNNLYNVELYYLGNIYKFTAFLDTGNRLYDQYKRRPIILVNTDKISFDYSKGILVPFKTADGKTVLRCLIADKIVIDNKVTKQNVVFGLVSEKFNIEEVNMLLHSDLLGG
ncbi:MAG: sigma-E processing peptidase SpoIIGA [Bacilli bacterium]|nr:sigma-E processing peptidase SpoIIGA [Bacilli bacterium]